MFNFTCFTQKSFVISGLTLALTLNACSVSNSGMSLSNSSGSLSNSSESVSKSSESFSTASKSFRSLASSSKTSSGYETEVLDYTVAYLRSTPTPSDYSGFKKGISNIAAQNGVADWESKSETFRAIGKGLKQAGITGIGYSTYQKNFAAADATKMHYIQEGYDSQD